jgi:hypothetical protein
MRPKRGTRIRPPDEAVFERLNSALERALWPVQSVYYSFFQ